MNADQLLAHYEKIADATDAIARLRGFILDLAVRGKLVQQDPNDEPASELLKRISEEKARLAKAGEIKKARPLPPLSETDHPFELPLGWSWVRLGNVSQLVTSGSRDWAKYYSNEGAIFVRMGNLSKDHYRLRLTHIQRVKPPVDGEGTRTRLEAGDLLISITGDVGMLGLIPEDFGEAYINQHTAMVRLMPDMRGRYLAELFRSPFAQDQFNEPQRGIKNSFRLTDVLHFIVPLPPLAEQHRIVAKVDDLMGLLDRLEAARTAREATRDSLTAASLARLTAPDTEAETFRAHARFALDTLPALTSRPDQIKPLRQTILKLAVVGKLTEALEGDLPAIEELQLIVRRKKDTAYRKPKKVAPIKESEQWCHLPVGWEWARWDHITNWITYGFTRPMEHGSEGVPIITGKNVNDGKIIFQTANLTPPEAFCALSDKDKPQAGDLLITKDGSIGRTAIVEGDRPFCINQSVAVLWLRSCHLDRRFLQMALDCPQTQSELLEKTAGVAIKHISITNLGKMVFPVPPLAEQHRIVAKVDELMALCDRLEATLANADTTRARLLDAVLHEALTPAAKAVILAAE